MISLARVLSRDMARSVLQLVNTFDVVVVNGGRIDHTITILDCILEYYKSTIGDGAVWPRKYRETVKHYRARAFLLVVLGFDEKIRRVFFCCALYPRPLLKSVIILRSS